MANQPSPVLNIRCSCMVQKPSHIWMLYLEWLQSQQYESSHCPHPPLQAALPPLCMAALPSPIWKRTLVPRVRWRKTRRTYLIGNLLSWSCVSDLLYWSKRRELLLAVTQDDSKTPTPVLHNTSVVVWNLYCVRVIIVRLNKRSKSRSFVHN
jgi:hypothetical protein